MFIKNKIIPFILALLLTDCFSFLLSFFVAFYFRFYILPTENIKIYPFNIYMLLCIFLVPIWILFINFFIGYKLFYISKFNLFIKVLKIATSFIIFVLALNFIIKNDFSRLNNCIYNIQIKH